MAKKNSYLEKFDQSDGCSMGSQGSSVSSDEKHMRRLVLYAHANVYPMLNIISTLIVIYIYEAKTKGKT